MKNKQEKLQIKNIPQELKNIPHWIHWIFSNDENGKPTKKPRRITGKYASTTDPETWSTYDDAIKALDYRRQNDLPVAGIGFILTPDTGIVAIDVDHCYDDGFNDGAKEIINKFNCYTEISHSGHGIHIFCKGEKPNNKCKSGDFEMYNSVRFIAVTGMTAGLENRQYGKRIVTRQHAIDWFSETHFPTPTPTQLKNSHNTTSGTLEEILEKAMAAKNGDKFNALWCGQWSDKYSSQSEADLALCNMLAFYCGQDKNKIDTLFRQSALMRDKWDRLGESTIDFVLYNMTDFYTWTSLPSEAVVSLMKEVKNKSPEIKPDPISEITAEIEKNTEKDFTRIYTIDELGKLPPPTWQIEKHSYVGGLHIVYGPSGVGKTFYCLDMALSIATGKKFLGEYSVKKGPVLYICAEGSGGISSRVKSWVDYYVKKPDAFGVCTQPFQIDDDESFYKMKLNLDFELRRLNWCPIAIFIDTLARNFGGDENSTKDMCKFVKHLDTLQLKCNCSVYIIHHTPKDVSRGPRGSNSLFGASDSTIYLTGSTKTSITIKNEKQKEAEQFKSYSLISKRVGGSIVLKPENTISKKWKTLKEQHKELFVNLVNKFGTDIFTMMDVIQLGDTNSTLWGRLEKLVESNFLNKNDKKYQCNANGFYLIEQFKTDQIKTLLKG